MVASELLRTGRSHPYTLAGDGDLLAARHVVLFEGGLDAVGDPAAREFTVVEVAVGFGQAQLDQGGVVLAAQSLDREQRALKEFGLGRSFDPLGVVVVSVVRTRFGFREALGGFRFFSCHGDSATVFPRYRDILQY